MDNVKQLSREINELVKRDSELEFGTSEYMENRRLLAEKTKQLFGADVTPIPGEQELNGFVSDACLEGDCPACGGLSIPCDCNCHQMQTEDEPKQWFCDLCGAESNGDRLCVICKEAMRRALEQIEQEMAR